MHPNFDVPFSGGQSRRQIWELWKYVELSSRPSRLWSTCEEPDRQTFLLATRLAGVQCSDKARGCLLADLHIDCFMVMSYSSRRKAKETQSEQKEILNSRQSLNVDARAKLWSSLIVWVILSLSFALALFPFLSFLFAIIMQPALPTFFEAAIKTQALLQVHYWVPKLPRTDKVGWLKRCESSSTKLLERLYRRGRKE